MRLQQIAISGFKSFPERADLVFDDGVTAIVGPNGCGKSNVIDAITWVLGEQSAKSLRGERMEDVIFAGSDGRKPIGAAEVKLCLARVNAAPGQVGGPDPGARPAAAPGNGSSAPAGPADGADNGHLASAAGGVASALDGSSVDGADNGRPAAIGGGSAPAGSAMDGADNADLSAAQDNGTSASARSSADGADNGHPADNGASAPLALDDADLDDLLPLITRDIEVSRRLYRSGESEYLIDGRVCRLRDIQDLLMDSGVGVKAYAVIEQGKIGQILGARPTERRQLLEEAAGVTKYKSRRRAAELKLDSARQNLIRVDDIIHEVEKQRRSLKRQAARARRYRRLREELRRWETLGFARRHRALASDLATARTRLGAAREIEEAAAAQVAAAEGNRERRQIELAEAESAATRSRDAAHALELAVERRQQQLAFDGRQIETLAETLTELAGELTDLRAKQDPARQELETQIEDARRCAADRDEVGAGVRSKEGEIAQAQLALDGLDGDVEAARSEVFAAVNAATALQHAIEHASASHERLGESMAKLDAEAADLAIESDELEAERARLDAAGRDAGAALERVQAACAEREAELVSVRGEREALVGDLRRHEQGLAELTGRLTSLRDLEATRADYTDAARLLLSEDGSGVSHLGSVADHLEVAPGRERAVEACLGDLLQHVVVPSRAEAEAGIAFVRSRGAGRVGFVLVDAAEGVASDSDAPAAALDSVASAVEVAGPGAAAVGAAIGGHWLAPSAEAAASAAEQSAAPIATPEGVVFRGPVRLDGGAGAEAVGILATKRQIRELEAQIAAEEAEVERLTAAIAERDAAAAAAQTALDELQQERHRLEKTMLGHEMQRDAAAAGARRLADKREQIAAERRTVTEEREGLEVRRDEARASIERLEGEQRGADERLEAAQRRVFEGRESVEGLRRGLAEVKARHAGLVERASALEAGVLRIERANRELDERLERRTAEHARVGASREALIAAVADSRRQLDGEVEKLTALREDVRAADEQVLDLRQRLDTEDGAARLARAALEERRSEAAEIDLARATAERDLDHLAETCRDTLQLTLEEVSARAEEIERDGLADVGRIVGEPEEDGDAATGESAVGEAAVGESAKGGEAAAVGEAAAGESAKGGEAAEGGEADGAGAAADAECATGPEGDSSAAGAETGSFAAGASVVDIDRTIAVLREKIERLGPVNMMAIEEFDDLDERYDFLTGQRNDLVESIEATVDAITRINKTTRERFREAFDAINAHFQRTFSTLFGGGRAGLALLDETDLLESGVDIIAQPPGKRLQSIQLLSGGEKALTAMALMFAIFRFKPSPFCLLDEIDAPLDEANISRFVEMLRGMQSETQFILVTHNRKTMEIADRLYGVTMEEPGVSKLVSVQLGQA